MTEQTQCQSKKCEWVRTDEDKIAWECAHPDCNGRAEFPNTPPQILDALFCSEAAPR